MAIYSIFKIYILMEYLLINVCIILLGIVEDTKMGAVDTTCPRSWFAPFIH